MSRGMKRFVFSTVCTLLILMIGVAGGILFLRYESKNDQSKKKPDALLTDYVSSLQNADYETMYGMLDQQSQQNISLENFTARNKNIYEGIEAEDIKAEITGVDLKDEEATVAYQMSLNSVAGEISFSSQAVFKKEKKVGYKLEWNDSMIFPELNKTDKVKVVTDEAERGNIYDRNGFLLAGKGTASSVGLVPGKMSQDSGKDVEKLGELLSISPENIQKKLSAGWVKEDSFVPLKTLKKADDFKLQSEHASEEDKKNKELQDQLLTIPGVLITDTSVRSYPLGEKGAHLIGYVQNVTSEDLEKHKGEDYLTDSVIGKSGMEGLYEKELKGTNGRTISIADASGNSKKKLAVKPRSDGADITLTIDSTLQSAIYDAFLEDKSCSVAMNPHTGEILALVSTPSYDDNDFILGMPSDKWDSLNNDERKPLFNRFRQKFAPGSSFKPITAVVGLESGAIDPNEDYGSTGLSWRKDESWGNYSVTTLHDSSPLNLENAFIYSNNIYFAKAALKIGYDDFMAGLNKLGFNQPLPFEISVAQSQYSNSDRIESEVQLADSGYGQGQMLVNPVHLAALYTMFSNEGNVIQPVIKAEQNAAPKVWLQGASSAENANLVREDLIKVVSSEHGTGHAIMRSDIKLAGKTGTAEIKASKGDTTGTELGWFSVFTADPDTKSPLLLISMVEDVKNRGGSGYVVRKDKLILDSYLPAQ